MTLLKKCLFFRSGEILRQCWRKVKASIRSSFSVIAYVNFELMFALVLTLGLGLAFADRDNQGLGIINFRNRNNESLDFVKRTLRLDLG